MTKHNKNKQVSTRIDKNTSEISEILYVICRNFVTPLENSVVTSETEDVE